jgi:hypothetical protein
MLGASTQMGLQMMMISLARRYMTRLPHMRYPVVQKTVYLDMMFAKMMKSLGQQMGAQVFMDIVSFAHAYPIKKKSEAGDQHEKLLGTLA